MMMMMMWIVTSCPAAMARSRSAAQGTISNLPSSNFILRCWLSVNLKIGSFCKTICAGIYARVRGQQGRPGRYGQCHGYMSTFWKVAWVALSCVSCFPLHWYGDPEWLVCWGSISLELLNHESWYHLKWDCLIYLIWGFFKLVSNAIICSSFFRLTRTR